MNILVIYELNQNDSYCLFSAISECLSKNQTFKILLKNINRLSTTEETAWYKTISYHFKDRISVYNQKKDSEISIICSLTEKTPHFFLKAQRPSLVGIFNKNQKIITYDYTSPFLLMKNCPNKLNRENIYNIIINGSVAKHTLLEKKQNQNLLNYKNEKIFQEDQNQTLKMEIEESELKNIITSSTVELQMRDVAYSCKKYGDLHFYSSGKLLNIFEEIIHLSIMFGIHNIDYVIPPAKTNSTDLKSFQECLEHGFECLDFINLFIDQNDYKKVNDSINLFNISMSRYQVFAPIKEFFEIAYKTCPEIDLDIKNRQLKNLCEITQTVLKTAYHLAHQTKKEELASISENN